MLPRSHPCDIYLAEQPFCVLCRRGLEIVLCNVDDFKDCEDWETDLFGFFNTSDDVYSCFDVHAFRIDRRQTDWPSAYDPLCTLRHRRERSRTLRVGIANFVCHDEEYVPCRALYFAHAVCWQAVRRCSAAAAAPPPPSFARLYKLGQQTHRILPPPPDDDHDDHDDNDWRQQEAVLGSLPSFDAAAAAVEAGREAEAEAEAEAEPPSDLRRLLARVASRLPAELQLAVLRHLRSGLAASLLRALETASRLLPLIRPPPAPTKTIRDLLQTGSNRAEGSEGGGGRLLVGSLMSVLGATYLHRITCVAANASTAMMPMAIPIKAETPVTGAKALLGPLGLQAVALVYGDGTTSPWLGRPKARPSESRYVDVVSDPAAAALRVAQDDLKVLRIGFDGMDERKTTEWPVRPLWRNGGAGAAPVADRDDLVITDTEQCPGQVLHYADRRLCAYLPLLLRGGAPATGLTMFCCTDGVCGIVSHFAGAERFEVGRRRGVPVHLPLVAGEHVTVVAFRTREASRRAASGPYMMIATNRGRTALFGLFISMFIAGTGWSFVTSGRRRVTGLIVDALTVDSDGRRFKSIGASVDATGAGGGGGPQPALRLSIAMAWTYHHETHPPLAFFSAARLEDAEKLQLQRRRRRGSPSSYCTGLLVRHRAGAAEVLGRWYPPSDDDGDDGDAVVDVVTIWDGTREGGGGPPPAALTFCLAEVPGGGCANCRAVRDFTALRITDVLPGGSSSSAGTPPAAGPHDLVYSTADERHLAWWFSCCSDYLELLGPIEMGRRRVETAWVSRWQPVRLRHVDSDELAAE